jgi:predicted transcriptional regulator
MPISRNSYKVLACIEAGIISPSRISDITRIEKDDVKGSLAVLNEMNLIRSEGLLAFLKREVTADGVRALSVYSKIFDEEDVQEVKARLGNGLGD